MHKYSLTYIYIIHYFFLNLICISHETRRQFFITNSLNNFINLKIMLALTKLLKQVAIPGYLVRQFILDK